MTRQTSVMQLVHFEELTCLYNDALAVHHVTSFDPQLFESRLETAHITPTDATELENSNNCQAEHLSTATDTSGQESGTRHKYTNPMPCSATVRWAANVPEALQFSDFFRQSPLVSRSL